MIALPLALFLIIFAAKNAGLRPQKRTQEGVPDAKSIR
jgi:hypothetical protein